MHTETLEEIASARRYAYATFQRLTGDKPTAELLGSLDLDVLRMSFEIVGAAPASSETKAESGAAFETEGAAAAGANAVDALIGQLTSAADNLVQVADEYARIFVGPSALPAPPWESVYRDKKRMLMTATTLSVREYYKAYGYEAQERLHVPDDHLAIELDFLAALAQEALDSLVAQDVESTEAAFRAGSAFLNAHLARWISDFAADLRERDGSPFYCAVADALCAFVAADKEL